MKAILSVLFFLSLICAIALAQDAGSGGTESPYGAARPELLSMEKILDEIGRSQRLQPVAPELSETSKSLLEGLKSEIHLEAFVSPRDSFPDSMLQSRLELWGLLDQLQAAGKGLLRVKVHEIESSDPLARTAKELGIVNKAEEQYFVSHEGQDRQWRKDLYLGTAMVGKSGKKIITPFFDPGIYVEYELVRSILSLSGPSTKKRIGVYPTNVPIMGSPGQVIAGLTIGGGTPPWHFITELRKQYEVVKVKDDPVETGDYDALLVVQPSTLDDPKLDRLIAAVKAGVPTAIFEDPLPFLVPVAGTYEEQRSSNQRPILPGQPPAPPPAKGNLSKLWNLLGVHFNAEPNGRLAAMARLLIDLEGTAKKQLQSMQGSKPVQDFMKNLDALQVSVGKLQEKRRSGAPLEASDWQSVDLGTLLVPLQKLDAKHPLHSLRMALERNVIPQVEKQFRGLEQFVLRDSYNPFPKITRGETFPDEFVYVEEPKTGLGKDAPSSKGSIVLLLGSGCFFDARHASLSFSSLLFTRGTESAGTTSLQDFRQTNPFGSGGGFNPNRTRFPGNGTQYVAAAWVSGKREEGSKAQTMKAALVADVDILADPFFNINQSSSSSFPLEVDNVDFALNLMDEIAGGSPLAALRKGKRSNRQTTIVTSLDEDLKLLNRETEEAVSKETRTLESIVKKFGATGLNPSPQNRKMIADSQARTSALERRQANLTAKLRDAPFTGWVRILDDSRRVIEERNYLGGMPHGVWTRFDKAGRQTFRQVHQSPNTKTPKLDLAALKQLEELRNKKQQPEIARIRRLYLSAPAQTNIGRQSVGASSSPTPPEQTNPAAKHEKKVSASHVLVAYKGSARSNSKITRTKEEAKARAEELLRQIKEGKDFAQVAREHSDGPTSTKGGDLGSFSFRAMVKPFAEAVFALEVGAVSGVIETPFGFHIAKRTK
jgi:hypothetical protein